MMERKGPLTGITVIEFAGLGPAPFAGMMLSDHGARVIRIDRATKRAPVRDSGAGALTARSSDVLARGRESIALDLKHPEATEIALSLIERADIVLEGFRPGVMESLGLGPDVCLARKPSLVYGRVTGWGQTGPLAQAAGHDINYIALAGALHSTARRGEPPVPAPGMIGDFGGGGMLLAFGVLSALHQAKLSGQGQVVDASICEGAALLASLMYGWRSAGIWHAEAGTNNGDGGAHFYDAYACADGKYISIGSIEPQFYKLLRELVGLDDAAFDQQWDESQWPALKERVAEAFRQKTRAEWCELLEGTDVCFAPVLSLDEAPHHPHYEARGTFATVDGITQPGPAPRFSATPAAPCHPVGAVGDSTSVLLAELGYSPDDIARLLDGVAQSV
ncbi:CaiB/BaiF CoA transferase family protein [Paraburkholderia diazotrophica]|uniref:Alpha-methylacyl-CoA racemase n=1 Tax=Paraburkholderia diazotrophica TaxID=667676 RepID=A0A1H7D8J5_9BURK|nr:CaiB/BaiF CoA-transferase family protein [Paraburkholderia diazotrophica]SEJ98058.1 alpha-methylacyl-CoA racemase [Paraburkholderia diazotrophica]